ncbi:OLC1v1020771C1 [Oldenlandia corymbosa var. corymbosa]|uniref:OLC1v1020771C1 n=1 Tax=Oldenlandia corymbosa var. corymbosa TaxID=529605 RepID=A0AAV1BXU3_OLDCO|nr:OLC1v1020771C1 [Oldenlandia corymbosa var. corymbosa]
MVTVEQLPDDMVENIFSRLPSESVVQCELVCKNWRLLAWSSLFLRLHLQRAKSTPIIYATFYTPCEPLRKETLCLYDDDHPEVEWKIKNVRLWMETMANGSSSLYNFRTLHSSCGGFLLFVDTTGQRLHLVNPLTDQRDTIYCPNHPGFVCGFFYHLRTNEFKVLYAKESSGDVNESSLSYCIYTFGAAKEWRTLEAVPPFPYAPSRSRSTPATCNGNLHWIVSQFREGGSANTPPSCSFKILTFEMDAERFSWLSYPGDECKHDKACQLELMSLLVVKEDEDEQLAFCKVDSSGLTIDIWILENYATKHWVKKWRVDLGCAIPGSRDLMHRVEALQIYKEELWLDCRELGVFVVYHLQKNTVRILGEPFKSRMDQIAGLSCLEYNHHKCVPYVRTHLPLVFESTL